MQIAGAECTICSETLVSHGDGRGCAACELVFHTECLRAQKDEKRSAKARAQYCPKCGETFKAAARAVRDARDTVAAAAEGRGRAFMGIIIGFLLLVGAVPLAMGALTAAPTSFVLINTVQLTLTSFILYCLWIGRTWALKLTVGLLLLGALWSGLYIGEETLPSAVRYAVAGIAITYTLAAGLLAFAPSVTAFIERQQQRHGSAGAPPERG